MMPWFPCFAILITSLVWLLTPSSAAMTRHIISVALPPFSLIALKAACPGVSRKHTVDARDALPSRKRGGTGTVNAVMIWVMPPASVPATSSAPAFLFEVLAFFFFFYPPEHPPPLRLFF
eukprot:CAMPEP_0118668752 /NCGR_PEP_ID=MMETSP0785-20121206/20517_1 /TAXON_ID=91992 /ORGANISM="Bolidomonas pacifica, Strain CCMP 1866" /LENGTH=119 /DNA_ID=CAMNT_0006563353 /DNA_START=246 /DNA_END=605 /DNA_ORIENTATION=+